MKNHGLNRTFINDPESSQRNLNLGSAAAFASLDEGLRAYLVQGDCYTMNRGLQNKEFLDYNGSELVTEAPVHLYDALRFDYEYPCDLMDYPVMDQDTDTIQIIQFTKYISNNTSISYVHRG
ncbi:hypothetical protein F0562_033211 [Nyssa sinensis]|uniref:Uncharacterized protein n=1 Tax=Nyssa sinensis TaxID=561372 RepID=A0A5J5ATN6_9ASTE|nr:hypothetical protein F0562_033211 [Nyssa sinensis]